MRIKKIIKYVLSVNGVISSLFSKTRVSNVVILPGDVINFEYATQSATQSGVYGASQSVSYDNTRSFVVTALGASPSTPVSGVTISIVGYSHTYKLVTGNSGIVSLVLPTDNYSYLATSATGSTVSGTFSVPPFGGTTSISI